MHADIIRYVELADCIQLMSMGTSMVFPKGISDKWCEAQIDLCYLPFVEHRGRWAQRTIFSLQRLNWFSTKYVSNYEFNSLLKSWPFQIGPKGKSWTHKDPWWTNWTAGQSTGHRDSWRFSMDWWEHHRRKEIRPGGKMCALLKLLGGCVNFWHHFSRERRWGYWEATQRQSQALLSVIRVKSQDTKQS